MFRYESAAELRVEERSTPDPRHRGVSFVERTWSLDTGEGETFELRPGAGETVEAAQRTRPQIVVETGERFWWMYEDRLYSSAEWHSPAEVMRLAEGGEPVKGERAARPFGFAMLLPLPADLLPKVGEVAPLLVL